MKSNEERDALILDNMKLVYHVLHKYYPSHAKNEDIIQEGMLGLVKAAENFNPEKGKFYNFAITSILNQIRQYFRDELPHSNNNVSIYNEVEFEDGEKTPYINTIVGDTDVNLVESDFNDFCKSVCERDRLILELSAGGYYDYEIAEKLGMSRYQVLYRTHQLREMWRECYGY
jgi:RNA polymerase sigma factor (sigma-70 family)